jgi:hypothetical protein
MVKWPCWERSFWDIWNILCELINTFFLLEVNFHLIFGSLFGALCWQIIIVWRIFTNPLWTCCLLQCPCYCAYYPLVLLPWLVQTGWPRALGIQPLFQTVLQWFISESWTPIFPLMYSGLVFLPLFKPFLLL